MSRTENDKQCGWCGHTFDCAVHNLPAYEPKGCDCGYDEKTDTIPGDE